VADFRLDVAHGLYFNAAGHCVKAGSSTMGLG
jgi:hypothetical protein